MTARPFDPTRVLGCEASQARDLLRGRRVTPGEVEAVAIHHYPWRRHTHDPDSYWVTVGQAASIIGLSPTAVRRLLDRNRLAYVVHASGVRLMRRDEVESLAATRAAITLPRPRASART